MLQSNECSEGEPGAPKEHEPRWRVLKFGGTSVSSAASWESVEHIVRARTAAGLSVVVVCSAIAGVTDLLTALVQAHRAGAPTEPGESPPNSEERAAQS